jgi:putative hydroxymethylpyrimidine transporter CytX
MTTIDRPVSDEARAEPGRTLAEPPPRTLGLVDQVALWGNLGISLLGPTAALFVLAPTGSPMSLQAAFTALVVGTLVGTLPVGLAALIGARTGQPAMVALRGLFGARLSYLPTVLNLLQCLGWAIFELVIIATAAEQLLPWKVRWLYIVLAGILTTLMALRPLGVVRTLRRYALVAVALSTVYFLVQFARHPLPELSHGSWSGFWLAVDAVVAVSISWVPLAADYTRHSRSGRSAFTGAYLGFTVAQAATYTLGLLAYSTILHADDASHTPLFSAFIALPLGWLPFAILVLRELDESFTNVYSTVVSVQNLRPLADRRLLAVTVGTLATLAALVLHVTDYQSFLYLIGSVFVPLSAVLVVDYFLLRGHERWNLTSAAPPRPWMLLPWLLGFCGYQLVNPGTVPGWSTAWTHLQTALSFVPSTWMSASLLSFLVAATATITIGMPLRLRNRDRTDVDDATRPLSEVDNR